MYLTIHAALGAVIGQSVGNPLAGFIGGAASHYLIDMLPHGDTERSGLRWTTKRILLVGIIDATIVCVGIILLSRAGYAMLHAPALAGILGGVVPDWLQLPYYYSNKKYFGWYIRIHNFFHNAVSRRFDFPWRVGLALQAVVLTAIISLLR